MIKYYIVRKQDINNDGRKEDLILKYRGEQFLGALPLKDYVDIDYYFTKMPVIPKKYYVIYTIHDYNRDKVKDHIVHIFSGNSNNYILSVPINEFMRNAKAYENYNKSNRFANDTNDIYNELNNKQSIGGGGKKVKGRKGGYPIQPQDMNVEESKKLAMQNQQMQYQQMQYQQMQNQQMQNQQMQNPQMPYQQMPYQQMQPVNSIFSEPSRVDNANSTLNKFMDATIAGGGLTLGSSIMNGIFDMFSGE